MNFIGNVIKEHRYKIGMSRKNLSDGICSEKYVYLIEKGERTPSSEMARLFGDRLGVDLFEYYEYLDCINPIDVAETIKNFNKFRRDNNSDALKKATDEAMALPDFHNEPWIYEIELNKMICMVLKEGRYEQAIVTAEDIVRKMEPKHSRVTCVANFYVLLSICYQMSMSLNNAKSVILLADEIIRDKQRILKYAQVVISVKIAKITMHYLSKEYDKAIEEGLLLNQYQIETSLYERAHHTLYYLAFSHFKIGLEDDGVLWFIKGLHTSLTRHKPLDIYYLSSYEMFDVLINDHRVPRELVNMFKKEYEMA